MIEFSLFQGAGFYRGLSKTGLIAASGKLRVAPAILAVLVVAWGVPAILAALEGVAANVNPARSYLLDIAAYAQVVISIPLLILTEPYVDHAMGLGIHELFQSQLVVREGRSGLRAQLTTASRPQLHAAVAIVLVVASFVVGLLFGRVEFANGVDSWHSLVVRRGLERATLAGLWNALISQPVVVFFYLRWFWKILVWDWVLWRVSRQKLNIHPAHPDGVGGLSFLTRIQSKFAPVILAVGLGVAGTSMYQIAMERQALVFLTTSGMGAVAYFIAAPTLMLMPLLLFYPALADAKERSLLHFGSLAMRLTSSIDKQHGASHNEPSSRLARGRHDGTSMSRATNKEAPPSMKKAMQNLALVDDYYKRIRSMPTIPLELEGPSRLFLAAVAPIIPPLVNSAVFTVLYQRFLEPFLTPR